MQVFLLVLNDPVLLLDRVAPSQQVAGLVIAGSFGAGWFEVEAHAARQRQIAENKRGRLLIRILRARLEER